ncbi:MAG: hypothetical protein IJ298_05240 [Ruminococcus sp.]|nr:hypothetical protein [Ruminococcus sp.]
MFEKTYKEFDRITPSEKAVSRAVQSALDAYDLTDDRLVCKFSRRKIIAGLLAACLVLVFAATLVFTLHSGYAIRPYAQDDYSFVINANANQVESLGESSGSTIAVYSGILSGGWAMYPNLERYEDFSPNFFQSYAFTNFSIEGKGIESVTFKSNAEGTYFALSPAGYFIYSDENIAEQEIKEAKKEYSGISLANSQYTADELSEYSDGLSFGNIYCDTFTYTNTKKCDVINLSNKLEFVIESNHSNKEISEKLDLLWLCEQEITELKSSHTFEGGEMSEDEERLYSELDRITQEIRQLILEDSTVDVTVKFTDGSVQTKYLQMGLTESENGELWLRVSEE